MATADYLANVEITIKVGSAEASASTILEARNTWTDLTESQIKEKVGELYRSTLSTILKARRKVSV